MRVEITFKSKEDGGRTNPFGGVIYCPTTKIGEQSLSMILNFDIPPQDGRGIGKLEFIMENPPEVKSGDMLPMYEGARLVGEVKIVS